MQILRNHFCFKYILVNLLHFHHTIICPHIHIVILISNLTIKGTQYRIQSVNIQLTHIGLDTSFKVLLQFINLIQVTLITNLGAQLFTPISKEANGTLTSYEWVHNSKQYINHSDVNYGYNHSNLSGCLPHNFTPIAIVHLLSEYEQQTIQLPMKY